MAARLAQFVAGEIGVRVGKFVMHISSMHIFSVERERVAQIAQSATIEG
jgi:thymidylate synthase